MRNLFPSLALLAMFVAAPAYAGDNVPGNCGNGSGAGNATCGQEMTPVKPTAKLTTTNTNTNANNNANVNGNTNKNKNVNNVKVASSASSVATSSSKSNAVGVGVGLGGKGGAGGEANAALSNTIGDNKSNSSSGGNAVIGGDTSVGIVHEATKRAAPSAISPNMVQTAVCVRSNGMALSLPGGSISGGGGDIVKFCKLAEMSKHAIDHHNRPDIAANLMCQDEDWHAASQDTARPCKTQAKTTSTRTASGPHYPFDN